MMKYVAVTCLIAVGPVIAMESLDESSQHTLARVAAEARAQGQKTAKTSTIVELDYITAPEEHVRHISLLTGVVQKPVRRLSTRLGDLIYTWYFVGSTVWARDVPAARDVCESLPLPPQSSLNKAQEAVVGIFGGKAVIDGVEVELLTNVQRDLVPGERYLFLGAHCQGGALAVTAANRYVLRIDPDNRLIAIDQEDSLALWVQSFQTVERFVAFLKSVKAR